MSKVYQCKHCGAPSTSVICASCFLQYDHRAYSDVDESVERELMAAAFEPVNAQPGGAEPVYSFKHDNKIMQSAETMLSWFSRMPRQH